jgi:DNA-binding XRE family transcriptional regulator
MHRQTIKRTRLRLGMTQRALGKRIGVTRSAMANFENGYRKISSFYMRRITLALRPKHYHHFAS